MSAAVLSLVLATTAALADDIQTQFDAAMQAIEADRLRTARDSLLSLLNANPSLHRARLELARVYYLSEDYAKARIEAQRVLDDPNTPPQVRATVLAFLAQIDADEKIYAARHQWSPSLYAGFMYDTNVNLGPTRDVVDIGGVPFNVTPDSQEQSDTAFVINPGIAHTYNPGRRIEAGEHTGFFLWQSQANAYYRAYFNEHDFNLGVLTARTGPAWVVPRHWRAAIGLQADQIWLGGESLALYGTLNPNITWEIDPNTEIGLDAAVTRRHYWDDAESGRDGWYESANLLFGRYFNNRKIGLQGGVGYSNFSADEERFSYDGPEVFAGVVVQAWTNGSVYARIGYRQFNYDGVEPFPFSVSRDDDEYRYTLGFQHDFRSGALNHWSLQGSWLYTDNHSNVAIYQYDRHQISLGLWRRF